MFTVYAFKQELDYNFLSVRLARNCLRKFLPIAIKFCKEPPRRQEMIIQHLIWTCPFEQE